VSSISRDTTTQSVQRTAELVFAWIKAARYAGRSAARARPAGDLRPASAGAAAFARTTLLVPKGIVGPRGQPERGAVVALSPCSTLDVVRHGRRSERLHCGPLQALLQEPLPAP
jgi:hypothetical protein